MGGFEWFEYWAERGWPALPLRLGWTEVDWVLFFAPEEFIWVRLLSVPVRDLYLRWLDWLCRSCMILGASSQTLPSSWYWSSSPVY